MTSAVHEPDEILLGFTRALRAAGVPVTQDRAQSYLAAVALVGADDARATYDAGRATLCASPDDLARYDQVHAGYFGARNGLPRSRQAETALPRNAGLDAGLDDGAAGVADAANGEEVLRALASDVELLRHRDVASLSAAERRRLDTMFASLRPAPPLRRARRHEGWHRGTVDASRTLRASLRNLGEPATIQWRRHRRKPRRVVLLIDVSGSMSGYADALLRLAHRMTNGPGTVETFTLGTRLTHVTRALRGRDAERALVAAGQAVPDWSGGTRLGETLRIFLDRWGRRGLARGAVVVVFSDGWERGDPGLLTEQMARLHRVAHRVVWVNPHRGKTGYQPLQRGVVAVLPHVDDFVAGHSLATYADLLKVVARA